MSNLVSLDNADKFGVMAKKIAQSGLFGAKNEFQAYSLMLIAESEGLHPIKAVQQYHLINGRPALKSTEVLSRFQLSGGKIKYIVSSETECEVEYTHPEAGSITIKWDIAKAKKAGLLDKKDSIWLKYPSNMLRARCHSDGVNAIYPACLGGAMTESQAQDIPVEALNEEDEEEIIVEVYDSAEDKKKLYMKLKKLNWNNAMCKEFFETYIPNDEVLQEVVSDENKLNELIGEFENGN